MLKKSSKTCHVGRYLAPIGGSTAAVGARRSEKGGLWRFRPGDQRLVTGDRASGGRGGLSMAVLRTLLLEDRAQEVQHDQRRHELLAVGMPACEVVVK